MELIKIKPYINSVRHQVKLAKFYLSKKNNICKNILKMFKRKNGRSSLFGSITVWHKGGGHKRLYRNINLRNRFFVSIFISSFYDPYRSSFVSLNFDLKNMAFFSSLISQNLRPGCILVCKNTVVEKKLGYRLPLKSIPVGTQIHSLSYSCDSGPVYIRSAGCYGQLIECLESENKAKVMLPSGRILRLSCMSYATIGAISNKNHSGVILGKAGRSRFLGTRPTTRGVAMNPVDHPHGGRTNGGRPSVSPWGVLTKGRYRLKKKHE